jgi:SAM-dependent methyltransferase
MQHVSETEGRHLFGRNPYGYDAVRPQYPDALFEFLCARDALFCGARTLEIGAGSGIATRRLVALGATPLVAIEPDTRFHPMLTDPAITLVPCAFEDADLSERSFDLVVAATAFHWLDPATRVQRVARALERGGAAALLWNVFSDSTRTDHFHLATRQLLGNLATNPSGGPATVPFALDRAARIAEFAGSGHFEFAGDEEVRWAVTLNAGQVRALYAGFSSISRVPAVERTALLDKLSHIAEHRFSGRVVRNITSVVYLFRRT